MISLVFFVILGVMIAKVIADGNARDQELERVEAQKAIQEKARFMRLHGAKGTDADLARMFDEVRKFDKVQQQRAEERERLLRR